MVKLSAIQLCSTPSLEENIASIDKQLSKLTVQDQNLVVLPECCLFFGGKDLQQLNLAIQTVKNNQLKNELSNLAKHHEVYLVAGSIPILNDSGDKFTNRSCVFSPKGQQLGYYDKIHLFDVTVNDNEKNYRESTVTQAGKSVSVVETPFAHVGLSICYDVRFPELYRQLRILGADIITVPSAFTQVTGQAHWQALLQARAIENQVYIVAAGQQGIHANGRKTWGHSMIISPWGEILASLPIGEGIVSAEYLPKELTRIRNSMPVIEHNQFTVNLNKVDKL